MRAIANTYRSHRISTLTDGVQNLRGKTGMVILSFHTNSGDANMYAPLHLRDGQSLLTVWTRSEIQQLRSNASGNTYTFRSKGRVEVAEIELDPNNNEVKGVTHRSYSAWREGLTYLLDHLDRDFLALTLDVGPFLQASSAIRRQLHQAKRVES